MRRWLHLHRKRLSDFRGLPLHQQSIPAGHLIFVCNICGARSSAELTHVVDRGLATCSNCKSSNRFRSVVAALQERLFNEVMPLTHLQSRKEITGLGMTDSRVYSKLLEQKFNYTNTFYHAEPYLDITDPHPSFRDRFDFVISSDVMEHVRPPIEVAFRNLRSLLRPSGLLVLTVPFVREGDTVEHFPNLYQFEILGDGEERHVVNITRNGKKEIFRNLVFHGGKGATLEMRLFSESGLLKLLRDSGFRDIEIHQRVLPQWGIVHFHLKSLPITAFAV